MALSTALFLVPGAAGGYVRFQSSEILYDTTSEPVAVAVGDVNSDRRPDIVMGTFSHGFGRESPDDLKLLVFLQRPDHTFERQPPLSDSGTLSVAVADMDGDGENEILSAGGGGVGLGAWRHTSDGSFSYSQIASVCCDLVAANMDSDSRDEVVAASTGGIWIVDWSEADNTYEQVQLTTRWIPEMDVADVNSDGLQDVVAYGHHRFSLFMQDAEGRFTEQSFDVSDVTHDGLATADVTGDSREDVVVTASHNTPYSRLKVFPQLPQGGISPNPIVYDSYDLPESLSVLDMTGDGREDVVVLHDGWMRIGVYEQSATGGLGPEQLFPKRYAGNYPYPDLRLADLDADARPDIAVMDQLGLFIMRRLPPPATPYVRPKAASPIRLPLVPSYKECGSPNAHHGPPLAFGSCSPGAPESAFVTFGTPDANGKPANGQGWERIAAVPGVPGTPENEADMRIDMSVSDVRTKRICPTTRASCMRR